MENEMKLRCYMDELLVPQESNIFPMELTPEDEEFDRKLAAKYNLVLASEEESCI